MYNINLIQNIAIDRKALLKRLGYIDKKQEVSRSFVGLVTAILDLAHMLIQPKQIVNISNIDKFSESSLKLDNGFIIESKNVSNLLQCCSKVFSFVITIGPKLENKRDHFFKQNEPTQAMLLDACGSVAIETYADKLNKSAESEFAKKDFILTKRYSPGYGDWHISAQKNFLGLLSAKKIGVELNDNFIMTPEKSISALIGLKSKTK
ncbi:MAG: vitamin B12 dependent-methionine synthase activation domain-containing protein [bacterium]